MLRRSTTAGFEFLRWSYVVCEHDSITATESRIRHRAEMFRSEFCSAADNENIACIWGLVLIWESAGRCGQG